MSHFCFHLPRPTPSLNEIQGWHWSHARREKQTLSLLVASALNRITPAIPRATGRRRLTIVRVGKGRLDHDNLVGGTKWLVDEIKARGLILDDDPDSVELSVSQIVARNLPPHTNVTLEDL